MILSTLRIMETAASLPNSSAPTLYISARTIADVIIRHDERVFRTLASPASPTTVSTTAQRQSLQLKYLEALPTSSTARPTANRPPRWDSTPNPSSTPSRNSAKKGGWKMSRMGNTSDSNNDKGTTTNSLALNDYRHNLSSSLRTNAASSSLNIVTSPFLLLPADRSFS